VKLETVALVVFLLIAADGGTSHAQTADDSDLLRRAVLPAARAWFNDFTSQGILAPVANALTRWAGIESSGNPLATSKLGERGLLQCGEAVGKVVYSPTEWAALISPETTRSEHVRLAIKLFVWLSTQAAKYVSDWPSEPLDRVFYAKMLHQWPADFHGAKSQHMHGPAIAMARELAARWQGSAPKSFHRLHAASVVAFGVLNPWEGNV